MHTIVIVILAVMIHPGVAACPAGIFVRSILINQTYPRLTVMVVNGMSALHGGMSLAFIS